ncbi:MAG: 4Fe-4S ferredoxin [Armatimonadota bacterium]
MQHFDAEESASSTDVGTRPSQLRQWPVQLHLVSPMAPYFQGADVVLAADCVAYSLGDFHKDYLKGKSLAIACPKLDDGQDVYVEKIKSLIDDAKINTLTVMIMEVPCCSGLLNLARRASESAGKKVPIKCITVGLRGDVLAEEWV